MANQELTNYIRQKISAGVDVSIIKKSLIEKGWKEGDINDSLLEIQGDNLPVPPPNNSFSKSSEKKLPVKIIAAAVSILVLVLIVFGVFILKDKIGLFMISPYTEKNLLSGLLSASSKINSSSYSASASLEVAKRDSDAEPFVTKLSNAEDTKQKYQNDYKRSQDVTAILSQLKYQKSGYPKTLQSLKTSNSYNYNYYNNLSITDPATQKTYNYIVTDSGNNFSLTIAFDTEAAISQIRKSYNYSDASTIINNKSVTFTKNSYPYLYLTSTPPKPFLVSLADYVSYIPPETIASGTLSAQSDWSNKSTDWKFNADAKGDFGDLTYKVNLDAIRKDSIYYFRINNLPSFFFSYIGLEKGKWISVDPEKISSSGGSYSGISSFAKELPEAEKYYKEHRQETTDLLKKIVTIADEKGLFSFKKPPYFEDINGRKLFRYDLAINKNAILPFYEALIGEIDKSSIKNYYPPISVDRGYLEYLQSPEFSEVFDYYQKNTSLTIWVDSQGFPGIVSYTYRIVPLDSAVQLKDKQVNLAFKLDLSDINKSVNIQAPLDAQDLQEVLKTNPAYVKSQDSYIKSYMSSMLTDAAIYYDTNGNYNNWCSGTRYASDKKIIEDQYGGKMDCRCNGLNCISASKWCASVLLNSGSYYCVDSSGIRTESSKANICSNGLCK